MSRAWSHESMCIFLKILSNSVCLGCGVCIVVWWEISLKGILGTDFEGF